MGGAAKQAGLRERRIERGGNLVRREVAAVHDPDVVIRVDRDPDSRAEQPVVRQRLRPERVDLEQRRVRDHPLSPDHAALDPAPHQAGGHQDAQAHHNQFSLHVRVLLRLLADQHRPRPQVRCAQPATYRGVWQARTGSFCPVTSRSGDRVRGGGGDATEHVPRERAGRAPCSPHCHRIRAHIPRYGFRPVRHDGSPTRHDGDPTRHRRVIRCTVRRAARHPLAPTGHKGASS